MSLALDTAALRARFLDEWDDEAITTVFANGEDVDVDETQPFVRFSISPGSKAHIMGADIYSQLGRVWLQIFMPAHSGTATAYEIADRFTAIFRRWRSDDGFLRCGDEDITTIPSGENGVFQVNVSIRFESIRRLP